MKKSILIMCTLAITCNPQMNENTWLEVVGDEEYAEAVQK